MRMREIVRVEMGYQSMRGPNASYCPSSRSKRRRPLSVRSRLCACAPFGALSFRVPPAGVHSAEIAHGHVRSGGGDSGGLGVG
jgi:hypothetical protein